MTTVYASSVCIPRRVPALERVQTYLDHGISDIELGGRITSDASMLAQLQRSPANLILHNYFPSPAEPFFINLSSPDEHIRQRTIDYIIENIRRTAAWGSRVYSFHAGFIFDPVDVNADGLVFVQPPATDLQVEAAICRFVEGLRFIMPYAAQHHVMLAIENNVCRAEHIGHLLLQTPDEFLDLFQRIQHPNLGVLIDIGHVMVTATTLGLQPERFISALQAHIKAFHVSQNDGLHDEALPMTADNLFLDQIKTVPEAVVVVEAYFEHMQDLAHHIRWLKDELKANST